MRKSAFLNLTQTSAFLFAAAFLSGAIGYFYNPVVIAPKLGAEGIAVLGTCISIYALLSFLHRPVALTITRYIAQYSAQNRPGAIATVITGSLRKILIHGGWFSLILFLFVPSASKFLNLNSPWPVAAAILLVYLGLFQTVVLSAFQGLGRFRQFSLILIADPVMRLVTGCILFLAGLKLTGALAGYFAGFIGSTLLGCWLLRGFLGSGSKEPVDALEMYKYSLPGLILSMHGSLALSVDVFIAKHYFSDFDAGIYIAASTLAKILLILINPVNLVSFSHMSDAASRKENPKHLLWKSFLLTGGITLPFTGILFLFSHPIILLTYGNEFQNSVPLLGISGLAVIPLVLTALYTQYCMVIRNFAFLGGLVLGAVFRITFFILYHEDLHQVIFASLAGGIAELILSILTSRLFSSSAEKETQPADSEFPHPL